MKSAIKALLGAVGLATAGQLGQLTAEARNASRRATELEARVAALRDDVETWKRRYEESTRAAAESKQAAAAATKKAERAAADTERGAARVEEAKARADALAAQVRDLRDRLDRANHAASTAREHLMAIEVKLDVVEAAIQVLDTRTRDAVVRS
jgi:chromosome segregation ATPase